MKGTYLTQGIKRESLFLHSPGDPAIRTSDTGGLGKLAIFQNQDQSLLRSYHAGPLPSFIMYFRCRRPVPAQGTLVVRIVYVLSTLLGPPLRVRQAHTNPLALLGPYQEQEIGEGNQCQNLYGRAL